MSSEKISLDFKETSNNEGTNENALIGNSQPLDGLNVVGPAQLKQNSRSPLAHPVDINSIANVDVDFDAIQDQLFIPDSGEPITTTLDPTEIRNANILENVLNYNPVVMSYPYELDPNSAVFDPVELPENDVLGNTLLDFQNPADNQRIIANKEGLQPLNFSIKATNYDRYNNKAFKKLFNDIGFHPYIDNETMYNANSTWWDENARMRSQWGRVFSTGFTSTWDAIGDVIQGRGWTSSDRDGAEVFEDAMRIGNSSKEGVGAFMNNLALNSGYTFGILANIAVEELALAGLEYITMGGATPIVASRTAYNAIRLGKAFDKTIDVTRAAKQSKTLLGSLKNADHAYDFFGNAGRWAMNVVTPNTYKAIKNISTTKNTAKALSLFARNAKTAGGFYRDVRMINLAMSESKLEAGMVENKMYNDLYNEYVAEYGSRPIGDALKEIKEKSGEAAFTTLMWNFPVIFFSNQFVLGTALRGFRGIGSFFNKGSRDITKRILTRSPKQITKEFAKSGVKTAFIDGGKSALGRIWKKGISGNLRGALGSLLRYSSFNLAEGFQEITQEAIAVGAEDYYKNLYADPAMGGIDAMQASVYAGLNSQMSGQGFEVFMSGFLMGGLVQGPQKACI